MADAFLRARKSSRRFGRAQEGGQPMILARIIIIGVPLLIAILAVRRTLSVEAENRMLRSFLDKLAAQARQATEIDRAMKHNLEEGPMEQPGRKY